jgi:hypothetical protein
VHSRDVLVRELEEFAADRETHGKEVRARQARTAADELKNGAEKVFFERVYYVVGDEPDRYTAYTGSREQIEGELQGYAGHASERKLPEISSALARLAGGAQRVRIGHLVYEVVSV